jgi:serine/threonine protein kinase
MKTEKPELLGQGSFGCVFAPKIPCEKETPFVSQAKKVAKTKQVSKVFIDKDDFSKELSKSKMAAKVDPEGKTMLLPTSSCKTSNEVVKAATKSAYHDCDAFIEHYVNSSSRFYQLNMPYGGKRVDKYLKSLERKKDILQFLRDMIPVLEGLVLLDKQKVCHQDIKPSNMLYTPQGNIILIDYSLMKSYDQIYTKPNLSPLKHRYLPYPPEYKMYVLFYKKQCSDHACPYLEEIRGNLYSFGGEKYQSYRVFHSAADDEKYLRQLYKWTLTVADKLDAEYMKFANKIDVYSTGMCMVMMHPYLTREGIKQSIVKQYEKLLYDMTHPHPEKRIDATQALVRAQKLLEDSVGSERRK